MDIQEMKDVHRIFVFVDTEMGQDVETMKRILSLEEVKDVHLVSGEYDLLVVLEVNVHGTAIFTSIQELALKAVQKIRRVEGVRDTHSIVPFLSLTKGGK
jgi:DNA-binding Lrp family transcriptional regulator